MLPHDGGAGGGRGRCTGLPAAVVLRRAGPAGLRPGCFMRGPRGLKKPYTAGSDAPPLRPGPANRPVSGRHTGRSAAQYGPFRSLLRPVCQCVVNQGIAQPRLWVVLFLQKWVLRQGACAARGVESGPPGGRRRWRVTWRNGPRGHGLPGVSAASAPPLLATLKPHAAGCHMPLPPGQTATAGAHAAEVSR